MNVPHPAAELTRAYEALRAQAIDELPATTPRGLGLLLAAGVPTWMNAWEPLASPAPKTLPAQPHDRQPLVGLDADVVHLLTEMALGCQKRWTP